MVKMSKCPICQTEVNDYTEVYISPYNQQEYKKYECPNCDVHWWEPLKIIPEFYEKELFETYIMRHEGLTKLGINHKAFFEYFPKNKKGNLLDVGCGDGVFLKEAQKHGFEVWGIDFDRNSLENVKRNLGLKTVFAMSLEKFMSYAKREGLKFDVITFFEVLEHQDKPREFLQMVYELLEDGGYIAGSVPNRESFFQVEFHQKNSWIDFPPHHFLRFSKSSLEKTLSLSGFKNVKIYKLDFPFKELLPHIEKKLFGNLDWFKIKLKSLVLGDERKAKAYAVEKLMEISTNKEKVYLLKGLKFIKNMIVLPFSLLFYVGRLKGNGADLYFQAEKCRFG